MSRAYGSSRSAPRRGRGAEASARKKRRRSPRPGLGELQEGTGRTIRRVHVIGGGSRNSLLSRFTAEATGLPVVAGPAEGTAVGNIPVQAMADGARGSLPRPR